MNGWMKYCQRKGLCPTCTKSLCVCVKGSRIHNPGLNRRQQINDPEFMSGDRIRVDYPGHFLHNEEGEIDRFSGTNHAVVRFPNRPSPLVVARQYLRRLHEPIVVHNPYEEQAGVEQEHEARNRRKMIDKTEADMRRTGHYD